MSLTPERLSIWWSFIRSSPITNMFYPFILYLHKPKTKNLYFFITYIIVFITNGLEKELFKSLYELLDVDTLPLIGKGERPEGATNCGTYLVYPDKPATSYGMPSGHSEINWYFITYIILDILYTSNYKNINISDLSINITILLSYAIVNSYSRVNIEGCHTTGQVVVGGILGIIKAVLLYSLGRLIFS